MGYHMGIVQLDERLGIPIWGGPGLPKMRHPRQNKSTKGLAVYHRIGYNRGMENKLNLTLPIFIGVAFISICGFAVCGIIIEAIFAHFA